MRKYAIGALIGVFAMMLISATVSRVTTWSEGDTLTAAALNDEFDAVLAGVNSISDDNISSSAAITPSKIDSSIAGTGLDYTAGVLSGAPRRDVDADPAASGTVGEGTSSASINHQNDTSENVISNLTLTTTGRAVMVWVAGATGTNASGVSCLGTSGTVTARLYRDSTKIGEFTWYSEPDGIFINTFVPVTIDQPSTGTYDYEFRTQNSSTSHDCTYEYVAVYAVEL